MIKLKWGIIDETAEPYGFFGRFFIRFNRGSHGHIRLPRVVFSGAFGDSFAIDRGIYEGGKNAKNDFDGFFNPRHGSFWRFDCHLVHLPRPPIDRLVWGRRSGLFPHNPWIDHRYIHLVNLFVWGSTLGLASSTHVVFDSFNGFFPPRGGIELYT